MEKTYKLPPIAWLRITDYMHGWIQRELGCALRVGAQHVISVQHLPGAREILRMETEEDVMGGKVIVNSMSAALKNCIESGLQLDPDAILGQYGLTAGALKMFMPVECPRMCINKNGVLRPWTLEVNFGRQQSSALQKLLRETFWQAVGEFAEEYAREHEGEKYAQIDMIEAFCAETKTPDELAETMRREWQRRMKRT